MPVGRSPHRRDVSPTCPARRRHGAAQPHPRDGCADRWAHGAGTRRPRHRERQSDARRHAGRLVEPGRVAVRDRAIRVDDTRRIGSADLAVTDRAVGQPDTERTGRGRRTDADADRSPRRRPERSAAAGADRDPRHDPSTHGATDASADRDTRPDRDTGPDRDTRPDRDTGDDAAPDRATHAGADAEADAGRRQDEGPATAVPVGRLRPARTQQGGTAGPPTVRPQVDDPRRHRDRRGPAPRPRRDRRLGPAADRRRRAARPRHRVVSLRPRVRPRSDPRGDGGVDRPVGGSGRSTEPDTCPSVRPVARGEPAAIVRRWSRAVHHPTDVIRDAARGPCRTARRVVVAAAGRRLRWVHAPTRVLVVRSPDLHGCAARFAVLRGAPLPALRCVPPRRAPRGRPALLAPPPEPRGRPGTTERRGAPARGSSRGSPPEDAGRNGPLTGSRWARRRDEHDPRRNVSPAGRRPRVEAARPADSATRTRPLRASSGRGACP